MTSRLLVDKLEGKTSSGTLQMPACHVIQTQTAERYAQTFTNSTSYETL